MSGHAGFVWAAFGVSGLILTAMIADSLLRARHWKRERAKLAAKAGEP